MEGMWSEWFFQFVFAATAATIVSGAVAERCSFTAYFVYSLFITGFVYPVVTHWGWTEEGWLAVGGYSDFAGSGLVHLLGAVAALCGAAFLGPRLGRFGTGLFDVDKNAVAKGGKIEGHSVPLAALGGFLLIVGFFSFNGGSLLSIHNPTDGPTYGKIVTNTMLAGSTSGITSLMLNRISFKGQPTGKFSILVTINGILAGRQGGRKLETGVDDRMLPMRNGGTGVYRILPKLTVDHGNIPVVIFFLFGVSHLSRR